MTGRHVWTIRRVMREGKLAASNKSGYWVTTRQAVADWLGVELDDVKTSWSTRDDEPAA